MPFRVSHKASGVANYSQPRGSTRFISTGGVITISDQESDRRAEAFRQARHSTEMEGGRTSDESRRDQDEFAEGRISEDELHRRIRVRHGLD